MVQRLWRRPCNEVLFRPEEVVLASSAAPVHNSVFWGYLSDDPIIPLQMDPFGALGAGVVQLDAVAAVLAVHQQEEVDGSRYAKLIFTVQHYRMEGEAQAVKKPTVVCGQRVGVHWLAVDES